MNTLDEILRVAQGDTRSLDCTFTVRLPRFYSPEELTAGAQRVLATFAQLAGVHYSLRTEGELRAFALTDLAGPQHLEQLVWQQGDQQYLALKMSHLLGDAVSMLLFLTTQLSLAPAATAFTLKSFPPKRDTSSRHWRTSLPWPRRGKISRARGFRTAVLTHSRDAGHEALALALLNALPQDRAALWIPVNVREEFWSGFGNGLSRLRLYRPATTLTNVERIAALKAQKKAAMTSGEVSLPPQGFSLSHPAKRLAFKLWLRRPWADWGSLVFSHLIDRGQSPLSFFHDFVGVTNLAPAHNAGVFAVTRADRTWATLTFDAQIVSAQEADQLLSSWQKELDALLG